MEVFNEIIVAAGKILAIGSIPPLMCAIIIGLCVGILQSAMQLQDVALSYAPKAILVSICICLFFPWVAAEIIELLQSAMETAAGRSL